MSLFYFRLPFYHPKWLLVEDSVVIMRLTSLSLLFCRQLMRVNIVFILNGQSLCRIEPQLKCICLAMLIHLYDTIKCAQRLAVTCDISWRIKKWFYVLQKRVKHQRRRSQIFSSLFISWFFLCLLQHLNRNAHITLYVLVVIKRIILF